jgi:hypothetical protein
MKRFLAPFGFCLTLACGGSSNPTGNNPPDGSIPDGGADGGVLACIDRPADLSRPPAPGVLPCDLIPPR